MQNELLSRIDEELHGVKKTDVVEIGGHKYGMNVLSRQEAAMARGLGAENSTMVEALSDNTLPTLAYALKSIDDTPVENLFVIPDDMPDDERNIVTATADATRRWRARKVYDWLGSKPDTFVDRLWIGYLDLRQASRTALEELENFSNETLSGA